MKYLSFALILAGCGAEIDDLYGRSDSGDGAGNGTGAASSSPTTGGGPGNTSSNVGGAPSSNNSSSTNSSNSNNSSTTTSSMGGMATTNVTSTNSTTGPDPSSSQQTTSGPPDAIFVHCGESLCDVSDGNVCCIGGGLGASCIAEDQCPFDDVAAACDDPFDCDGGEVCCGFVDNSSYYEEIRCASDCNWPDRTLCLPGGPPCEQIFSGGMLQDAVCDQSSILPDGYLVCKLP